MKEFWNTIQLIFTATGGWLGWFLGGCDGLLYALIAFVVVDYITGVMCAAADKKLSSEVGFKGLWGLQISLMCRSSARGASCGRQSSFSISPTRA